MAGVHQLSDRKLSKPVIRYLKSFMRVLWLASTEIER